MCRCDGVPVGDMADISKATCKRIRDLHALVLGGATPGEREAAWRKLVALLKKLGKTTNDLIELLRDDSPPPPPPPPPDPRDAASPPDEVVNPADAICHLLKQYSALEPYHYIAVPLWILHTHVYDQFMHTPRLFLTSPVRNCGKTTLLDVCSCLVARAEKTDSITAAAIYHAVDKEKLTLLIDEFDKLHPEIKGTMHAILNSGYRKRGKRTLTVNGKLKTYRTFAPMVIVSIGLAPAKDLMSRCIVIPMRRDDGSRRLRRFEMADTTDLDRAYSHSRWWATNAAINPNPDMPAELRGRHADNWRPLIAVADACSSEWGRFARQAAIAFAADHHDEDVLETLLRDIWEEIFKVRGRASIFSKTLCDELNALDDAPWSEWTGIREDRQPRPLSQGELSRLLKSFGIRPQTIRQGDKTSKGYYRWQFEDAYKSYCRRPDNNSDNERSHGNVSYLAGSRRGGAGSA
jgi:Protein of unknown function (DUF3631)